MLVGAAEDERVAVLGRGETGRDVEHRKWKAAYDKYPLPYHDTKSSNCMIKQGILRRVQQSKSHYPDYYSKTDAYT